MSAVQGEPATPDVVDRKYSTHRGDGGTDSARVRVNTAQARIQEPKAGIKVAAAMLSAAQCLAKAEDLEQKAAQDLPSHARDDYRAMAREWRRLAGRALIQDQRAIIAARTSEAS